MVGRAGQGRSRAAGRPSKTCGGAELEGIGSGCVGGAAFARAGSVRRGGADRWEAGGAVGTSVRRGGGIIPVSSSLSGDAAHAVLISEGFSQASADASSGRARADQLVGAQA